MDEFVRIGRDQGIKTRQSLGEACARYQRQGPKGNAIYFFFSFPALEAAVSGKGAKIKSKSKRNSKQESSPKWSEHTLHHRALKSPVVEPKHTMHTNSKLHHRSLTSPVVERMNTKYKLHHRLLKSPVVEPMNKNVASPITQIPGGRAKVV